MIKEALVRGAQRPNRAVVVDRGTFRDADTDSEIDYTKHADGSVTVTDERLSKDAQREVRAAPKRHAEAYRRRAGMIGALMSCVCTWPLDVEPTPTGHHAACPANAVLSKV